MRQDNYILPQVPAMQLFKVALINYIAIESFIITGTKYNRKLQINLHVEYVFTNKSAKTNPRYGRKMLHYL